MDGAQEYVSAAQSKLRLLFSGDAIVRTIQQAEARLSSILDHEDTTDA